MENSLSLLLSLSWFLILLSSTYSTIISHDERAITVDGERRIFISGSIHYPRSTAEMWPDLIKKSKEGGLDTIETYVFWNVHEPARREYDFSGNLDLVRFIKTVQDAGLYAVLRIGPYVCAEWNYGGFPVWLHNIPDIEFRTTNSIFMNEMQNFTTLIVNMMKEEELFASQGGPIILAQIENEYGNIMSSYGPAGKAYIDWCASMADSLNIGVPWIMCQQRDAPEPMIEACNGFYCDQYQPSNPNHPKLWTENWTGWFKNWGGKHPFRTAEDLAFAVARFFQTGGTFQNYYMYHGGTNFGRTAGGPYITTSYDYNAPLDEFGQLNQPKWGHLKQLHAHLKSMEKCLTYGNVSTVDLGNSVTATIFATNEGSSCFISNTNETADALINFQGNEYSVPAWSVSVLPECQKEAYNTAKVNTQTSVMVKKSDQDQSSQLEWSWRPEIAEQILLKGKGDVEGNELIDQKDAANDASDYLWYMTRIYLGKTDPVWSRNMTLRIHSNAHVLHAYVNGEHIGTQFVTDGKYEFDFEKKVKLVHGTNQIALLSVTVGLKNYGAFLDLSPVGIVGPVQIVGYKDDERIEKDLSTKKWTYKIGLNGFDSELFSSNSTSNLKWSKENVRTNRMLTWYKTSFKAPLGNDPVVVDLQGLGKGMAWINGQSIGRYWPSFKADENGCNSECDYRGTYGSDKCAFKCGEPTQRWYHVPRSFLKDGDNTLTLFEEMGGNPSEVNFKTVVVGKVCAKAYEHNIVELSCQGRPISAVNFASFGNPTGACGAFASGTCEGDKDAVTAVAKECVGKETCEIDVSSNKFGTADCGDSVKQLAVEVAC